MPKFRVRGETTVYVYVVLEAANEAEAIEKADAELGCLDSYLGNGGDDKIVGVRDTDDMIASVEPNEYIEWKGAELDQT
jgi:hypothetical protein